LRAGNLKKMVKTFAESEAAQENKIGSERFQK
jgi:hypothetical protein